MTTTAYKDLGPSPDALPITEKQLKYAQSLAVRLGLVLPWEVQQDRKSLSTWIDAHKDMATDKPDFGAYPSSKQVAFAERIARIKCTEVPQHCFKDRTSMSRWIDEMRPR